MLPDPFLSAVLSAAGGAMVRAMTDADWRGVRDGLARLVAGRDPHRADELSRQLDESYQGLHSGRTGRADLEDMWQARLERLLREHPELRQPVGDLLRAHAVPGPVTTTGVYGHGNRVVGGDDRSVRDHSIRIDGKRHNFGNQITVRKFAVGGAVAAVALILLVTVVWPRVAPLLEPEQAPPAVLLDLRPASGARGDRIQVEGHGFEPGERVKVLFHVSQAARVQAGADGSVHAKVTVPDGTMAFGGQTFVSAVGERSGRGQQAAFTLEGSGLPGTR